jgi:hypothetical protein
MRLRKKTPMVEPEQRGALAENLHNFRMERSLCIMAAQLYRVSGHPDRAAVQLRLAAGFDEPIASIRATLASPR